MAMRARIVLACAEGLQSKQVAARLGVDEATVGKWRRRFAERRLDGLYDEPRSGAPRTVDDARVEAVIVKTLESTPGNATHWSSRGMAKASGLSVSTAQKRSIEARIASADLVQRKGFGSALWAAMNDMMSARSPTTLR
jgi:transposase-like protein